MNTKSYKETINGITYDVVEIFDLNIQENISSKQYHLNGKYHNESGPAIIWYYKNGNIESKSYFINDKYHNENGPAQIWYYDNGNIKREEYYVFNKKFDSLEDIKQYLKYRNF